MPNNETLSQHSEQIESGIDSYKSTFQGALVYSSGVIAAQNGYAVENATYPNYSEFLKAGNSLPPTSEKGMEY